MGATLAKNKSLESFEDQQWSFVKAVSLLSSESEVKDFLEDLLSERELQSVVKRWSAVVALEKGGQTQKAIAKQCGLDKNTVGRVHKTIVKKGTGISRIIFDRLNGAMKRGKK